MFINIVSFFVIFYSSSIETTGTCLTPTQQKGQCKSILECPFLKGLATKTNIMKKDIYFLRQSACGFEKSIPKVCCPEYDRGPCLSTDAPPDPWSGCCGRAVSERYTKSTFVPAIDQYPWMAIVEYDKDNKTELRCSAVLISGRYLLSTAFCFYGPVLNKYRIGIPKRVRLGEFNLTNDGPDCVGNIDDLYCTDGALIVPIERALVHPKYDARKNLNDITLIRLSKRVSYTDFIRPICLPTKDITENPPSYFPLQLAGWGATETSHSYSDVLKHVGLPFVVLKTCQEYYNSKYLRYNLEASHICAGKSGRDSCKGDTGAPLMYEAGLFTEALGITSFGPVTCGSEIPGVYTKVFTYLEWIQENVEPWNWVHKI